MAKIYGPVDAVTPTGGTATPWRANDTAREYPKVKGGRDEGVRDVPST